MMLNLTLLWLILSLKISISEGYRKINYGNWLELVQIKPVQHAPLRIAGYSCSVVAEKKGKSNQAKKQQQNSATTASNINKILPFQPRFSCQSTMKKYPPIQVDSRNSVAFGVAGPWLAHLQPFDWLVPRKQWSSLPVLAHVASGVGYPRASAWSSKWVHPWLVSESFACYRTWFQAHDQDRSRDLWIIGPTRWLPLRHSTGPKKLSLCSRCTDSLLLVWLPIDRSSKQLKQVSLSASTSPGTVGKWGITIRIEHSLKCSIKNILAGRGRFRFRLRISDCQKSRGVQIRQRLINSGCLLRPRVGEEFN